MPVACYLNWAFCIKAQHIWLFVAFFFSFLLPISFSASTRKEPWTWPQVLLTIKPPDSQVAMWLHPSQWGDAYMANWKPLLMVFMQFSSPCLLRPDCQWWSGLWLPSWTLKRRTSPRERKWEDGGAWLLEPIRGAVSMSLGCRFQNLMWQGNRCAAFSSCGHTLPVGPTPPRSLVFCCSGAESCKSSPSAICRMGRELWMHNRGRTFARWFSWPRLSCPRRNCCPPHSEEPPALTIRGLLVSTGQFLASRPALSCWTATRLSTALLTHNQLYLKEIEWKVPERDAWYFKPHAVPNSIIKSCTGIPCPV
jgi:hypothetical protein